MLLMFLAGISVDPQAALAAPVSPNLAEYPAAMTITPTKQVNPGPLVGPGQVVTYSITFTADDAPGTVLITDAVPLSTTYQPGSITAAGSAGVVISTAILSNMLVWTATNVATNSQVTAQFVVTVSLDAAPGAPIANTAWLTDGTRFYSTTTTITTTNEEAKIYLPIIIEPPPTDLTVVAERTGGITYFRVGSPSAPVCEVTQIIPDCDPNNCNDPANKPCPPFEAGNYDVVATTNRCGTLTASNRFFAPGPHIIRVFCN